MFKNYGMIILIVSSLVMVEISKLIPLWIILLPAVHAILSASNKIPDPDKIKTELSDIFWVLFLIGSFMFAYVSLSLILEIIFKATRKEFVFSTINILGFLGALFIVLLEAKYHLTFQKANRDKIKQR